MQVNFCVKKPNPLVNYHLSQFEVENVEINNVNFHIPTLISEVKRLKKNKLNKHKKIIKTFLATMSTFLILPLTSMANTTIPVTATNLPQKAEGLPPELLNLLIQLLVISVGTAVILSAILLVGAAVMKMFRKRKEANEWTVDIIKGLVQVLVAVPVVFLIYYVSTLLFGGSSWHVNPF